MRMLLVDNHDSYTYNLFQLMAKVNGITPTVITNDAGDWATVRSEPFDAVVISPGPGHPANDRDFGHSRAVLHEHRLPVLGVCLGHQGIGMHFGCQVANAPRPLHGHITRVRHDGDGLFAGIPQDFAAVRYHSFCLDDAVSPDIAVTARAEDGVIMGIQHRQLPMWGVQFHPESVATEYGFELLDNFRTLVETHHGTRERVTLTPAAPPSRDHRPPPTLTVVTRVLDRAIDTEQAFARLHGDSASAFWLDSSRLMAGMSRFSFLGDTTGPRGEQLSYRVGDDHVTVVGADSVTTESGDIFSVLEDRLHERVVGPHDLPFGFVGGYVGYFGYELKALCGGTDRHRSAEPAAGWLYVERFVAVDHVQGRTHLVALAAPGEAEVARAWLDEVAAALAEVPDDPGATVPGEAATVPDLEPFLVRDRDRYLSDIEECRRQLIAGESYEICLTDKLILPAPDDDLACYRRLRHVNAAPYAAFLAFGELAVLSSSPERFLTVDRHRIVESKPIKGTAPRHADPSVDEQRRAALAADPKTRAENLMIVDLLRNDLGRVCEVGSVHVPDLMVVESYATVHQLVSTIRGRLRPEMSLTDCVRACFPGGSMTGAPKQRTMEIIDELETEARGVYSGALGYLGLDGQADLSIVIRTAVRWRDRLCVGAGGAVVLDSDPVAEYEEMLLKAAASVRALNHLPSLSRKE